MNPTFYVIRRRTLPHGTEVYHEHIDFRRPPRTYKTAEGAQRVLSRLIEAQSSWLPLDATAAVLRVVWTTEELLTTSNSDQ